ncbi:MAG: CYTH domain-containing protein [Candidatus Neomarinimicrobiota bacterium]|nr:MAG: CYTH domain-containing protein [Candidatus Neomarinimicrobiota bacterium]
MDTHLEIERRFLVADPGILEGRSGTEIYQGYLSTGRETLVRIRLAGTEAWLGIKARTDTLQIRREFEYPVPRDEAQELLTLCGSRTIHKIRYRLPVAHHVWEVDRFLDQNRGLTIAEIELNSPAEKVHIPDWLGEEITEDPRYLNVSLAAHPFLTWKP